MRGLKKPGFLRRAEADKDQRLTKREAEKRRGEDCEDAVIVELIDEFGVDQGIVGL